MRKKTPTLAIHIFHPAYRRDIDGLRAIAVLSGRQGIYPFSHQGHSQ